MNTRKLLHSLGALADLGAEISSSHDFEEVVQASLHTLLGTLAIRKGAISRYSSSPGQLKIIAARGLRDAVGSRVSLGKDEVDRLIKRPGPFDLAAERNGLAHFVQRNGENLKRLRAAAIVPMVARGELMGVIFLSEKFSGEDYDSEDLAIIATISRHIGVAIYNHRLLVSIRRRAEENRRLYRELRDTYQNTIRAFAAAIDLKDAYTKGHSDRVARYSEAIAREMGVEGQELELISVAGYLHDIGKIVVDRAIINNPRPLTDREFKELNTHVVTGYEILSSINRPWNEIAYMTKCHHERVDGKGYPQGLRGDEIPLGARIVTVADSFDAMMTDRPYRSRLSLEAALEELRRNSGRQFDAGVVSAFCRLVMKEIAGELPRVLTSTSGRGYDKKLVVTTLNSMIDAPGPPPQTPV
jgi:putative nucleotidyltransferase with HDIG domain